MKPSFPLGWRATVTTAYVHRDKRLVHPQYMVIVVHGDLVEHHRVKTLAEARAVIARFPRRRERFDHLPEQELRVARGRRRIATAA